MGTYKNEMLHIRVPAELKAQLKAIAEVQNRTVTNLIETVLKHYVSGEANQKEDQLNRLRDSR